MNLAPEWRRMCAEIEQKGSEIARLRKGIQDFLDGNWGTRYKKIERCPHGALGSEDCIGCIDEYFRGVLTTDCDTCGNGSRIPEKLREVERGPRGEPRYVCADCGRGPAHTSAD